MTREQLSSPLLTRNYCLELEKVFLKSRLTLNLKVPEQYKDLNTLNLGSFLGGMSWLVFENLKFTKNDLEWCQVNCKNWEKFSSYKRFKSRVYKLLVVNDPAERALGLLQD